LLYRGFCSSGKIISHVVWLYFWFARSFRNLEELMACRGIIVTYETIRQWTLKIRPGLMSMNFAVINRSAGTMAFRRGGAEHQVKALLPGARGR
jgi:hypothetical protein